MIRCALYARYSSDKQRDASIEDQLRLCREHAERQGWHVVESHADHATSGANLLRPGVQALLADALAGKFTIILAESLDRLSRDQEDTAAIFKRVGFAGVKIVHVVGGRDQRAACRPQGHDERALSQGPRRQDPDVACAVESRLGSRAAVSLMAIGWYMRSVPTVS